MSFTYRYRKQIIAVFLFLFVVSGGGLFLYRYSSRKKGSVSKKEVLLASKKEKKEDQDSTKEIQEQEEEVYLVDIKGEVVNPGLYSLKKGSRVSDVIAVAGGITANGDTSVVNLSKKIVDEMVIIIYSKSEVESFKETKEEEKRVIEECQTYYEGVPNDACISSNTTENSSVSSTISINTATVQELQSLPGIGEAKAKSILQYREEHGPFQDLQELKNVEGIGDSIFDQIKDYITL